jgi:hypothetical protein
MNSSMNTVFVNTSYTAVPIAEKRQNPEKAIQARLIKQAKRTALENERANTHRFFELDSEARLVNLAHIAALQMKEAPGCETLGDDGVTSPMSLPDDSFSACGDEVVYSAPSVPTEPVSPECSLALVDGSRDMDFEDTFGCAFVRVAADVIEIPYHAFEHVAIVELHPDPKVHGEREVYIEVRYCGRRVMTNAYIVKTDIASDSVLLRVDENVLRPFKVTPYEPLDGRLFCWIEVFDGRQTRFSVWLDQLEDGWRVSAQPNGIVLSEGFSGAAAFCGGKLIARLYGSTCDRSTLLWSPCQSDVLQRCSNLWAVVRGIPSIPLSKTSPFPFGRLIPFGRNRRAKPVTGFEYARMSAVSREKLGKNGGDYVGYDYEADVTSVVSYDDYDNAEYDAKFGFDAFGGDRDFAANAEYREHQIGSRSGTYKRETFKMFAKKKKSSAAAPPAGQNPIIEEAEKSLEKEIQFVNEYVSPVEGEVKTVTFAAENPFDVYDVVDSSAESNNPFDFVQTAPLLQEFPNLVRKLPVEHGSSPLPLPVLDLNDPDVVKKAKEATITKEINKFNAEIQQLRESGTHLTQIIELSPTERMSLSGLHMTRRLAEKTAKAYRDKSVHDKIMHDRMLADAKKFARAQDAINTVTKQLADLQAKAEKLERAQNF